MQFDRLGRRDFITLLGGASAFSPIWPLAARAQQPATPLIGFLSARSADESAQHVAAFRRGLGEAGYVEGQNVAIEYRWAEGRLDRLPPLASQLVALRASVIVAIADPTPQIAKAATRTIPIVFAANGDPIRDTATRPASLYSVPPRWQSWSTCCMSWCRRPRRSAMR
jgi:putative ABC transport system substrate-binding protein